MKLYKRMVRPYFVEAAWPGMASNMAPLADWIDEDKKTEALEKEMDEKCKKLDYMSSLMWEAKYEEVSSQTPNDYVYVVSEGEYSDYHVEKVYSSMEAAELFVAAQTSASISRYGCGAHYYIDQWRISDGDVQSAKKIQYLFRYSPGDSNSIYKSLHSDELVLQMEPRLVEGWGHKKILYFSRDEAECPIKIAADIYSKLSAMSCEPIPEEVLKDLEEFESPAQTVSVYFERDKNTPILVPLNIINSFQKEYGSSWKEKLKETYGL